MSQSFKASTLIRWAPWGIGLFYFLLSLQLPFWGDSIASVSKAAVRIFEEGLNAPWNYPDADPGHPTLFPWLIALFWKIFGQSLAIAHALVALCLVVLIHLVQSYFRLYDEKLQLWGLLLLAISPLLVSQALEISLALPLTLAYFGAVHGLKKNNKLLWASCMVALSLLHLQGMMLLAALGLYDLMRSWPLNMKWWKRAPFYLLPLISFGLWAYFHYQEFGWAIFTPNYGRSAPGFGTVIYNLAISAWRLLDLGYFILALPVLWILFQALRKKSIADIDKLFIASFLLLCVGIPLIFAYPPSHRYILPVYLLLVPFFLRFLQRKKERAQVIWLSAAFLLLLSGNLWFYPGKCLGDQNLVFLSYMDLEAEISESLPENTTLYSFAPLNNPSKFTWLKEERAIRYTDLYDREFSEIDWILESNLNCEFTPEMKAQLASDFVARSFESYGVYVNVWMNKNLENRYPDFATKAHEPGPFESWMRNLKNKLKN